MPAEYNARSKYKELKKDPYFNTRFTGAWNRLKGIIESDEFKNEFIIPQKDKNKKVYDPFYYTLLNTVDGMEDIKSATGLKEKYEGIKSVVKLATHLKTKRGNETIYQKLKNAAGKIETNRPEAQISVDKFLDDLCYLDEKFSTSDSKWMNMSSFDKDSVVKKTTIEGERSWKNYANAHLMNIPHSQKGKKEYLAKAMVAAFREYEQDVQKKGVKFSTKAARNDAENLMKQPVFKKLCKDPVKLEKLLKMGANDHRKLVDATVHIYRPFFDMKQEDRVHILRNLKTMSMLMDPPGAGDTKWKELHVKLKAIDVSDPEGHPEKCSEKVLQDMFNSITSYMKGKKAVQKTEQERRMFNQSLNLLSECANAGEYARLSVESVFDRINEVRRSHDRDHKDLRPVKYGTSKMPVYTLKDDEKIKEYKNALKNPEGKPESPKYIRNVFEPYPKNDMSELFEWKKAQGDRPVRVNTELFKVLVFANDAPELAEEKKIMMLARQEKNAGRVMTEEQKEKRREKMRNHRQSPEEVALEGIATILALSECQMYFLERERAFKAFNGVDEGLRIEGSLAVISQKTYMEKVVKYMNDPAVRELSKNYISAESRKKLFKEGPYKNKDGSTVKRKESDPLNINVAKLKEEYEKMQKKLSAPQAGK